jgi:FixJ family two-component response regulator
MLMDTCCFATETSVAGHAWAACDQAVTRPLKAHATCSSPRPTVFQVDDDRSFLTAVARLLRASGFLVKTFRSAAELLDQPELDVPGCVLADLQMPDLNGLELQEVLGRAGCRMPVIFLSGHGDIPTTTRWRRNDE